MLLEIYLIISSSFLYTFRRLMSKLWEGASLVHLSRPLPSGTSMPLEEAVTLEIWTVRYVTNCDVSGNHFSHRAHVWKVQLPYTTVLLVGIMALSSRDLLKWCCSHLRSVLVRSQLMRLTGARSLQRCELLYYPYIEKNMNLLLSFINFIKLVFDVTHIGIYIAQVIIPWK